MTRMLSFALTLAFISPAFSQKQFGFDNRKSTGQPYLKPEESLAKMKVAEGFEVKLFAAEPQLVNPIAMTVDEKGRVWVVESFEYPRRTAKGKMPRDRITILESTRGDGVCDKVTHFAEGKDFPVPFDMASGIEVGNGGVYIGAPPYLFFIENKNDKPGKFEILLKGFGSEDTHETLNTFQWGPDGWLYGLHGIYSNSNVESPEQKGAGDRTRLNAGVWRYQPKTKKFEIFAEGTSNPWGMDYRNSDGQFILCCCVIPHLFHMTEGGIYKRQAGTSFNSAAYQLLPEICDHTFHRESGWAHAGLISLDTPLMPKKYRDSVIFGSIHGSSLKQNILKPKGSTFTASRGDDFLVSGDKNFRPINLRWGPNGEIYCIDWHDQNPCHQAPDDAWDYERGRVFRIQTKGLPTKKPEDLGACTADQLVQVMKTSQNPYATRTARRLLGERGLLPKPEAVGISASRVASPEAVAEFIRSEVEVANNPSTSKERRSEALTLVYRACVQENVPPRVLLQLAIACRKLVDKRFVGLMLALLISHVPDASDPVINQAIWLAFEERLSKDVRLQVDRLHQHSEGELVQTVIYPNSIRRLASMGDVAAYDQAVRFLGRLKAGNPRKLGLESFLTGLAVRAKAMPGEWPAIRDLYLKDGDANVVALTKRLAGKLADPSMIAESLAELANPKTPLAKRLESIRAIGQAREAAPVLARIVMAESSPELKTEAIRALAGSDGFTPPLEFLRDFKKRSASEKSGLLELFSSRKAGAIQLLHAVGDKTLERTDLTDNLILKLQAFKDKEVESLIEKHWGRSRATPAELQATIDKMRGELGQAPASFAKGKVVFETHCSKCHIFEGKGHQVGPMIEGAGRDIEYLLVNVLDPNRVIGAPYFLRTVNLSNGTVETGVLDSEDDKKLVLKQENAVLKTILKADIEEMKILEKSLMPEGLGYSMTTQDFRDLVRYAMKDPFVSGVELTWEPSGGGARQTSRLDIPVTGIVKLPVSQSRGHVTIKATVEAKEAFASELLIGSAGDHAVRWNGTPFQMKGDSGAVDSLRRNVDVKKGLNTIEISLPHDGSAKEITIRVADGERRLIWK